MDVGISVDILVTVAIAGTSTAHLGQQRVPLASTTHTADAGLISYFVGIIAIRQAVRTKIGDRIHGTIASKAVDIIPLLPLQGSINKEADTEAPEDGRRGKYLEARSQYLAEGIRVPIPVIEENRVGEDHCNSPTIVPQSEEGNQLEDMIIYSELFRNRRS